MARKKRASTSVPPAATSGGMLETYWESTHQPLYSLVFLFPLVAAYEFGAVLMRPGSPPERQLVAQNLVQVLLGMFGAFGYWLPGLALLITLTVWHLLTRNSWQVRAWIPPLMLAESIALTLPLFVLNRLRMTAETFQATPAANAWHADIVLALGAGIYEELVFRLMIISALMLLLVDLLGVPRKIAVGIAIVLAAAIFALSHVRPVGAELFAWPIFWMRAAAGAYLGLLFLGRGLGICTGCHAAYNLILVAGRPFS